MSKVAISVKNVEKSFRLPTESTDSLKRTFVNFFKGIKGYTTQDVLKGLSFDIYEGEFFGIVGRNGSGKSTLLKIISQIYTPEQGSVSVNGSLVSFIELGVGFNPELTGRENVYLNGSMLGFTKEEIDGFYDEIVSFSELEPFMNQKLKNYSSGMQVRLAFAVAIQSKSDILILDEVLAVGDEAFQRKCNEYFLNMKNSDKTIVLVTHSMDAVRQYCTRALFLDKGKISAIGSPDEVANLYTLENMRQSLPNQSLPKNAIKNIQVEVLGDDIISPTDTEMVFRISYEVIEEMSTYLTFSLIDINKNVVLLSDNSYENRTNGIGLKEYMFRVNKQNINHAQLKWSVTVKNEEQLPIAFYQSENQGIVIAKKEIKNVREIDTTYGVIDANGVWTLNEEE